MIDLYKVYTDGGARGNPGPAGCGIVIEKCQGNKCENVFEIGKYIGKATNNQAEYTALIIAIEKLLESDDALATSFNLDSQLVVEQLNGNYKVKNENIKPLYKKINSLLDKLNTKYTFTYIPRERNKLADKLVNKILDERI